MGLSNLRYEETIAGNGLLRGGEANFGKSKRNNETIAIPHDKIKERFTLIPGTGGIIFWVSGWFSLPLAEVSPL